MAKQNYRYPPAPPVGSSTAFNNIVGFQLVNGGGLTQGNFQFTTAIYEKVNRNFDLGIFSKLYNFLANVFYQIYTPVTSINSFLSQYGRKVSILINHK